MENNEELVTDVTENVEEQATEELVDGGTAEGTQTTADNTAEQPKGRFYTDEEIIELKKNHGRRVERKVRKDFNKKYGELENVLRAGTGEQELEKITDGFKTYYEQKGRTIPQAPQYDQEYIEYMADKEANEIIADGYDEIKNETDRLSKINVSDMTAEEKLLFTKLAKERSRIEDERELASIGVTQLDDKFKNFAKDLNPNLSTKEKYELYLKYNPKPKGEPIGSMKNGNDSSKGVKEYYTSEEADKFTKADYDKNPELYKAVCNSMQYWK